MNRNPVPQIYFMRPVGLNGPIKVGHSIHVGQRLQDCMKWSPLELEIVALLGVPNALDNLGYSRKRISGTLERRFHLRYADYRLHHEWFEFHPLILSDIQSINAGTFDIECLPEWRKADLAFIRGNPITVSGDPFPDAKARGLPCSRATLLLET